MGRRAMIRFADNPLPWWCSICYVDR